VKRTALARPFFSTARFAGVIPTRSASTPTDSLRLASITSTSTTIGIR
jgi:hypothetical protein